MYMCVYDRWCLIWREWDCIICLRNTPCKDMELIRIWDTTTIRKKDTSENRFEHQSHVTLDGQQTAAVMHLIWFKCNIYLYKYIYIYIKKGVPEAWKNRPTCSLFIYYFCLVPHLNPRSQELQRSKYLTLIYPTGQRPGRISSQLVAFHLEARQAMELWRASLEELLLARAMGIQVMLPTIPPVIRRSRRRSHPEK